MYGRSFRMFWKEMNYGYFYLERKRESLQLVKCCLFHGSLLPRVSSHSSRFMIKLYLHPWYSKGANGYETQESRGLFMDRGILRYYIILYIQHVFHLKNEIIPFKWIRIYGVYFLAVQAYKTHLLQQQFLMKIQITTQYHVIHKE
jgi:hypothetical protein